MLDSITAAAPPPDAPPSSAIAEDSAAVQSDAAASGQDNIADLDRQYKDNILVKDEPEEQPEELETAPEPQEEPQTEPEAEPEIDILAEPTGPRKLEDLKKQFPRAQTTALEEIAKVEADKWALQTKIEEIGGDPGIEVMKAVMPSLLNERPDQAAADTAFEALTQTNPALVLEMSRLFLDHAISEEAIDDATGLPTNIATGNYLINQRWEGETVESLDKLVAYKQAGLIDSEELDKDLEVYSAGESKTVKELKERLSAVESREKELQAAKEKEAQVQAQKRYEQASEHVTKQVMSSIVPIAEHFGWTATKEELNSPDPAIKELAQAKIALGEMLTDHMEAQKKRFSEWSAVDHLAKQGMAFNEDGNPTALFVKNYTALANKIVASFKQKVRVLNPTFAKSFNGNRAAQLKPQKRQAQTPEIPEPRKEPLAPKNDLEAAIRNLDDGYKAVLRDTRA